MTITTSIGRRSGNHSRSRRWLRRVWTVVSLFVALGSLYMALPASLGGRTTFTMVSGTSMEPVYHTYDLAIVYRGSDPKKGDIVVYRVPKGDPGEGGQVIHRVVGGDADDGYIMQGDNREGPDIWHPQREDVVGTVVVMVPKGGWVMAKFLKMTNLGLIAFGFIIWAVWPRSDDVDKSSPDEGEESSSNEERTGSLAPAADTGRQVLA